MIKSGGKKLREQELSEHWRPFNEGKEQPPAFASRKCKEQEKKKKNGIE